MRYALLCLVLAVGDCPPRPVVVEEYDGILAVAVHSLTQDYDTVTLYFCRGQRVIAERAVQEEMVFSCDGEGRFALQWVDGNVERLIRFKWLSAIETVVDSHEMSGDEWWNMRVRRTDLAEP